MSEEEYWNERKKKEYIKGLLYEIADETCDINQTAENIISLFKASKDSTVKTSMGNRQYITQKVVLGHIADIAANAEKKQVVAVATKITSYLREPEE